MFSESSVIAEPAFQGMPFQFVRPSWQGRGDNLAPSWIGRGDDSYVSAGQLKPSRLGGFGTGKAGATGGLGQLRTSENWNATLSVTVAAQFTGSLGDTTSQVDLLDFNGDRYPDRRDATRCVDQRRTEPPISRERQLRRRRTSPTATTRT